MTSPGAPIRRCPECGEEFQPHVVDCSDCGTPLVSAFEGDGAPEAGGDAGAAPVPEETVTLLSGVEGIRAVRFTSADVVRRDLVARIVDAYDKAK